MRQFEKYPIEGEAYYHRQPKTKDTQEAHATFALPVSHNRYMVVYMRASGVKPTKLPRKGEVPVLANPDPTLDAHHIGEIIDRGSKFECRTVRGLVTWHEDTLQEGISAVSMRHTVERTGRPTRLNVIE